MHLLVPLGLACSLLASGGALGGSVATRGPDQIQVSGTLSDADAAAFRHLVESRPGASTVIFERCLGGTASAAFEFARVIRERGLNTVAAGQCASACALAFLAGTKRSFTDQMGTTAIVLHVGSRTDGQGRSPDAINYQIMEAVGASTNGRLSPKLEDLIFRSWDPASGVLFMRMNSWLRKRDEVRYCDGSQGNDVDKCTRLDGFDAFSQGIVTEP